MKTFTLFIPLLLCYALAAAQPAGYVPGTQVCWTFNGRAHGYFKAAGNGERHILISFTGVGETGCANYDSQSPQKFLKDNGLNWDGRTVRTPGDTIIWEIYTVPNTSNMWMGAYISDINYLFNHIAPIDTSEHWRFHVEGLSFGVGRLWAFLGNSQGDYNPYRGIFSTTISIAGTQQDPALIASASGNTRNWVWVGSQDTGITRPSYSHNIYYAITGPKHFTYQVGGRHDGSTWDSCLSLKNTDTMTNRWLWMVRKPDTLTEPPIELPCPISGGPANYVAGTQVNWQFNNRSHGYFRAAGCGERHVLIAFTHDTSVDSTNYQLNSPAKILQDAGINWDGRSVRAPGDTIVWEVVTIPYNSGFYLPGYANDITYILQHIEPLDTANHDRYHIAGIGHGASRMWAYLINTQNHNSPYRHIFSTTLTVSTTWSSNYAPVTAYSAGRRHWVWHGASDTNPTTPPWASTDYYNALSGDKRLTMQTGGTFGASTWDSCFSIAGTDSSNNRWLWMATPPASPFLRTAAPIPPVLKSQKPESLRLYPNPSRGISRLSWNGKPGTAYRISVSDISGRIRKTETGIRGSTHVLDISNLDKGLYIVQVEGGGEKFVLKLIRE
ncbi:T9SS type A sorting domain-containing protein [Chitinophaga barathri]|uniref:T9SS C-terminal target domain-containing protein n=1 Tax=Chitinophaga barathri TaxID=1647451 RepID=A0A3N4MJS6_9BACT|nr:T9SS type A sorting domain-containing protein [Chitinophaga barathri]RPD42137.1 T9SS C-terminal target domain-containing protein [Chitinophaga barathri]